MDLETFEPYLRSLASIKIDPRLRTRIDVSDLVQKTFQEAVRSRPQFKGTTPAELVAWLKQVLVTTLLDEIRRLRRQKCNIDIEVAFDTTFHRLSGCAAADQPGPGTHVAQNEEADRLAEAIARLPEDQRRAVELHCLQEYSILETAGRLEKSAGAVSSLVHRAVLALRRDLGGNRHP